MESRTESILITGITGFTGKYLESYFIGKGFKVFGTTLNPLEIDTHFLCDITIKDQISKVLNAIKPDYIIHTAAISFVASSEQNNMYNVNVFGTLNLLEGLIGNNLNPKKIIIASSAAVYGTIGEELSESMCPKPINHYGNSKLAMENMVRNYFPLLPIIICRPFNYTGVGQAQNFLIPKVVHHYKKKKPQIELGNINVFREFNNINFLIEVYSRLLLSNEQSIVVNVCSGITYSIKQVLNILEEITSHKIEVNINPKFVRKNDIKNLRGNPEKLYGMVNTVRHIELRETLKSMLNSN